MAQVQETREAMKDGVWGMGWCVWTRVKGRGRDQSAGHWGGDKQAGAEDVSSRAAGLDMKGGG